MAAYEMALAGQPALVGAAKVTPGTMRALSVSYFNSAAFRSMSQTTQQDYRYVIERFCQEHSDKRVAALQREHVVKLMTGRKPNSANRLRKVLRVMMAHAVEIGMRADDPTREVRAVRIKTDGYHSWTEAEIAQFEARHPIGSRARLALALLLYTGQRRADVVHMGRQHVRDGLLYVRQRKTAVASIPVHSELAALSAGANGSPDLPGERLGAALHGRLILKLVPPQCDMANLHHCSAHGLRKAAARRLAEAGCTEHEIAAITGHASLREIARYTKAADQKRLAGSAMEKAKTRTSSVKLATGFDKKEKIS